MTSGLLRQLRTGTEGLFPIQKPRLPEIAVAEIFSHGVTIIGLGAIWIYFIGRHSVSFIVFGAQCLILSRSRFMQIMASGTCV